MICGGNFDIKKAISFVYLRHMANPGSLKPFQKGHDPRRNLKGRISKPLSEQDELKKYMVDYMNKSVTINGFKTTRLKIIAERIVDDAVRLNYPAIRILLDRTEGKVRPQPRGTRDSEYDPKEDKKLQAFIERMKEWDKEAEELKKKEASKNSTLS